LVGVGVGGTGVSVGVGVGGTGVLVGVGVGGTGVSVGVDVGGTDVLVGVGVGPVANVSTSSGGGLPSRDSNLTPLVLSGKNTKL
jgi:hypothetical protein